MRGLPGDGPALHASASEVAAVADTPALPRPLPRPLPPPVAPVGAESAPISDTSEERTALVPPSEPGVWPSSVPPAYRELRLGSRTIRVVPPNIHDPRIHLSSVILAILFIGMGWLGFRVSIPQIALTMAACAAMELVWVHRRTGTIAWPASALQTATSVSLLFRVIGTGENDFWSFHGWYLFVAVGAVSLLTKYTIRWRGSHVFNPSNIGLVAGFLVLGSQRVEPLDFWWAPLGWPMVAAYAVIFFGGFWICGRLRLLGLGLALWLSLAAGLGLVAIVGHCITTRWSFAPVCDGHFWWIVMTSPEIFIFLFFMITDPKTVPAGRVARVVFGTLLGLVCALLMAPWSTEFGAKVGLLSGLVVMCALRYPLERRLPAAGSDGDNLRRFFSRPLAARPTWSPVLTHTLAGVALVGALGVGITVAAVGADDARSDEPAVAAPAGSPDVDPSSIPPVTIDRDVAGLSAKLATPDGAHDLAMALSRNLEVEAEAMANGDGSLLPAVDDGQRLQDMQDAIEQAGDAHRMVPSYTFDTLHLTVVFPGGLQRGANAGLVATGTVTEVMLDAGGARLEQTQRPFATTFSLRQTPAGNWLTTDTLAPRT
jgi:hypothetical protein